MNPRNNIPKRPAIMVIGPSIAYIQLTRGQVCLIDSEDADSLSVWNWRASWNNTSQSYYAGRGHGFTTILLHRELMGVPRGVLCDHQNRNTLDNRKTNLRLATKSQNAYNSKLSVKSSTGIKGICFQAGKYVVYYKVNRKTVNGGSFDTIEEAAAKRRGLVEPLAKEFWREK